MAGEKCSTPSPTALDVFDVSQSRDGHIVIDPVCDDKHVDGSGDGGSGTLSERRSCSIPTSGGRMQVTVDKLVEELSKTMSESPNGLVFRFRDCSTPVPSALSDPSQEQQRTTVRQSVEIGILKNFTPAAARTSLGVHVNGPWGGTSLDVAAAGRKLIIKVQLALSLPSSKKQDRSTKVPVAPVQLQSSSVDQAVASPPSSPSPCVQASTSGFLVSREVLVSPAYALTTLFQLLTL
ncbi:uncharacterized protein LOC135812801 [Sycon ciliatum]|uniref:uncharacterized protein LOC135812801 n=1 Tax=Sycon ciliatum TaxID=27933 RepID=UPI0031F6074E